MSIYKAKQTGFVEYKYSESGLFVLVQNIRFALTAGLNAGLEHLAYPAVTVYHTHKRAKISDTNLFRGWTDAIRRIGNFRA